MKNLIASVVLTSALLADSSHADEYRVTHLSSLGGTVSRGNSLNDRGWVAGYSNLAGNQSRHAALWIGKKALDLGTLGGPNSSVTS